MNEHTPESPPPTRRSRFSQETITIVAVGVTLAGLILVTNSELRDEVAAMRAQAQADRDAWQAESRQLRDEVAADHEAWQAESRQLRDEAAADRAQNAADREHFQREILRLTGGQARLAAIVERPETR